VPDAKPEPSICTRKRRPLNFPENCDPFLKVSLLLQELPPGDMELYLELGPAGFRSGLSKERVGLVKFALRSPEGSLETGNDSFFKEAGVLSLSSLPQILRREEEAVRFPKLAFDPKDIRKVSKDIGANLRFPSVIA
jgi:hypothetical protein